MPQSTSQSRSQSQHESAYRRKRSSTLQSMLRSPVSASPLEVGNFKDLTLWVHDVSPSNPVEDVTFNLEFWPGVAEGDMIRVTETGGDGDGDARFERDGFLFVVKRPNDDSGRHSSALQISVSKAIANSFGLRNHSTVRLTKVDSSSMRSEYIEIVFQDQYLGRSDMWRLGKQLQGDCVHIGQDINFMGSPTGKIQNIYINGRNTSAGLVASRTKVIYRSLSAKVTIFIQICREIWEFAGDGERYTEKVVHSFLPALFRRWREADTNHTVTIVLISRVHYLESEIDYAAGPLRQDDEGRWYKDFFKVITDLEVLEDWKPTLVSLKESFVAFQRDILLTHHYHRASLQGINGEDAANPAEIKLVGRISFAHEGPILEALNLALNPMETHYVDRSLSLTGVALILVTPGTGYYKVNKRLLRMTTRRLLDQGVGLNLVSLTKHPLHRTPIFSFQGLQPEVRPDLLRSSWRNNDPLWGGDAEAADNLGRDKLTFWWEPFWIAMSLWDQQMDQPFRQDRFVARARMHQIEMLGLLEHDVLASINVPFLTEAVKTDDSLDDSENARLLEAENFDLRRFSLRKSPYIHLFKDSNPSSGTTIMLDSPSYQAPVTKRPAYVLHRTPTVTPRIAPIEESPRRIFMELPLEGVDRDAAITPILSSSPSSSIRSSRSNEPRKTETEKQISEKTDDRPSLAHKLTSSWLFSPFRSSARQASVTSASSAEVTQTTAVASTSYASTPTPRSAASSMVPTSQLRSGREPMTIRSPQTRRSMLTQPSEDEISGSNRSSLYSRHSPLGTPRSREESKFIPRRSTITSLGTVLASSSLDVQTNPLRSQMAMPRAQTALASRWQHMFPQPSYNYQMKWKSMVTPGCLPLTTEYLPTKSELDASYDVNAYEFVIEPSEMKSFLVKDPTTGKESPDSSRSSWALAIMRVMASLRLVQGFQFIVRPNSSDKQYARKENSTNYFSFDDDHTLKPVGASEILTTCTEPVFLSVSNEIHRISYNGEAIQVKRYVRRMPLSPAFSYKCLVWPKLGVGYTELSTPFGENGLENYGWNRLDMLLAGYNYWQFNESLRYWRTRFIVIPTLESPALSGNQDEKLNDEEIRLSGSDKLAELWSKLRVVPPSEKDKGVVPPPLRFLPTYLNPTASIIDEHLVSQLEEIMASGPLGKKLKSEREIADMGLSALAKIMREDRGLPIKDHRWHTRVYEDSFTGSDFATWLCREFRDVSTRDQAQEWGSRLLENGLFEHCRGRHGFLDGHYFYRLTNEYTIPRTPKSGRGWTPFRSVTRHVSMDEKDGRPLGFYPGSVVKPMTTAKKVRKRLVLSQTMVIDVDPNKRSNQAETAILHYDLIHNPANVFHFELHWLGTTPRCIEEQLRSWSSKIERYGLKLVEAYVTPISDIQERNPFQSCFPLRLAFPPPIVPDIDKRLALASLEVDATSQYYFEYELLKHFGFILDIEAKDLYPKSVDVFYSYRRNAFTHSQFVHRTGVAFVQVIGGSDGFLFLTNRLMGPGRMGTSSKSRGNRPAAAAETLRLQMHGFCQNQEMLSSFYDDVLAQLPLAPEEPPALII